MHLNCGIHFEMRKLFGLYLVIILAMVYQGDTQPKGLVMHLSELFPYADKIGHFLLWGGLGAMANLATRFRQVEVFGFRLHVGSLIAFAIAFAEEMSQYYFPHRHVEAADLMADALGIILIGRAGLAWQALQRLRSLPRSQPEAG